MKKFIVLVLAMLFVLCPNTVYAEVLEYDVYVNHVKQPFVGKMGEELLLPISETYDLLGAKHTYDKKFDSDVYTFSDYVVECYREDMVAFSPSAYLGDVIEIDGVNYGNERLFDIDVATMTVDHDNKCVKFLTRGYLETILMNETNELNKLAPDLVLAINSILNTGVDMNFNVNTTLTSISTESAVSASNPYKRTFIKVDGSGYGALKDEVCDVVFNVKLDKNNRANTAGGFEMRILDDMLYIMDPSNKQWLDQRFDDELGVVSAMALTHEDTLFIATLREHLVKTNLENGDTAYSIRLNEEALANLPETSAYGNVIKAIEEEMSSEESRYDLSALDVRFVIGDNKIKVIHAEVLVNESKATTKVDMNIAVDIEFLNQGFKKDVVSPKADETTLAQ